MITSGSQRINFVMFIVAYVMNAYVTCRVECNHKSVFSFFIILAK